MSKNENNIAFFDLDQTLYRGSKGYLIYDFPYYLQPLGLFSEQYLRQMENLLAAYQEKKIDRTDFAIKTVKSYYAGLQGKSITSIRILADKFWNVKGHQNVWFAYTPALVNLMNKHTQTILVTGSPSEILDHVVKKFSFTKMYATKGIVKNGVFTGEFRQTDEMATQSAKSRLIKELALEEKYQPAKSFAFGDSESDLPLLEAVNKKNAFVFGKSQELSLHIENNGWKQFGYEDDVINHLTNRVRQVFEN